MNPSHLRWQRKALAGLWALALGLCLLSATPGQALAQDDAPLAAPALFPLGAQLEASGPPLPAPSPPATPPWLGAARLERCAPVACCAPRCAPCAARGPVDVREEWILAQPRLTLPSISPDGLCCGQWEWRLATNRGNDFGWRQSGPAEDPTDRQFLVDAEHQTTEFVVRHGLSSVFTAGIRVPVQWRGAGFMDSPIDWFHEIGEGIGLLDNGRPLFDKDRYRVEGRDNDFNSISWTDDYGVGLGNIELSLHATLLRPRCPTDWRAALVGRVGLPTGTGPFDTGSVDLGLQAVVAKQVAPRWDVYGGMGGTWFSETEDDGVKYEPWRLHGFLVVEWRVARNWSLLVQSDAATRLVTNLASYPSEQWYLHLAARVDLGSGWQLQGGFTENLADQQSTVDFGAFLGVSLLR